MSDQRTETGAPTDAPLPPSPFKRPEFRKLLAISITVAVGFGMIVPILPDYARSFGVSLAAIGLTQSLFGLTRFSFGLVGGLVVDRFGERACTMAGLLIVSVSSYAVGFAQNFGQLVLARGFGGAGSALFIAGLMNRILRIIEPQAMGRATGAFRSSFLIGIGVGPVLGGVVAEAFGNRAPFHFYATGLILAAAIAYVVIPGREEGAVSAGRSPLEALRAARPLFKDRRYVVALLATLVGWWTIAGPGQTVGVIFANEVLGLSKVQFGLAITLLSVGEFFVLLIAGRASDRYGRKAVLIPALALAAVSTLLIGQLNADVRFLFFPLMVCMGAGVAAVSTASGGLLAESLPKGGSGAAVGLNQMAGDMGFILSQSAVTAIADWTSFRVAYIVGAIPAAVTLIVGLRLPKQTADPERSAGAGGRSASAPGEPEPHEPVG